MSEPQHSNFPDAGSGTPPMTGHAGGMDNNGPVRSTPPPLWRRYLPHLGNAVVHHRGQPQRRKICGCGGVHPDVPVRAAQVVLRHRHRRRRHARRRGVPGHPGLRDVGLGWLLFRAAWVVTIIWGCVSASGQNSTHIVNTSQRL